jgi:hypothetical protein
MGCERKKTDALHYRVHQNLEMAAGARGMDGGNINLFFFLSACFNRLIVSLALSLF